MPGTPANSMNLNATIPGIVNWDGVNVMSVTPLTQFCTLAAGSNKTIAQIAPSTAGYVLTSNGPGTFPTYQAASGSLASTFTGDSGVATSSLNNINILSTSTSGSSTSFTGSGSTLTFNVTDLNSNTFIGKSSGAATAGGQWSTSLGEGALQSITTGAAITAIGYQAAKSLVANSDGVFVGYKSGELATGIGSVFVGSQTARNITSGGYNVIIGYGSGSSYTSTESSNVLINSAGTVGDANTIRIGIQGSTAQTQNKCFIAGITGVTTSNTEIVTINTSTGQLGSSPSVQSINYNNIFLLGGM